MRVSIPHELAGVVSAEMISLFSGPRMTLLSNIEHLSLSSRRESQADSARGRVAI